MGDVCDGDVVDGGWVWGLGCVCGGVCVSGVVDVLYLQP